jgi:hypothetical protein
MILQALLDQPGIPTHRLPEVLAKEPDRVEKIVADLQREGFIKAINGLLSLS